MFNNMNNINSMHNSTYNSNLFTNPSNYIKIVEYQTKASRFYGKMDDYEKLMLKRTINTSFMIINCVEKIPFESLELALYMKIDDSDMLSLTRLYEFQIEEAKLHPDNFIHNLHSFLKQTGYKILENPRNFFDFIDFVLRKQREKQDYANILDGYVSLLVQQCSYFGFLKGLKEKICCGLTSNNQIIFKDDIYAYSDCANYDLENELYQLVTKGKEFNFDKVREAYKKYGYTVNSPDDIDYIDATARLYGNNYYLMSAYINENTLEMLPNKQFQQKQLDFPRQWVETDLLLEKLHKRKYCLPSDGILAQYYNAGEIKSIQYQEIYKNDKIILLYKVISKRNGEFTGYFDTMTQDFFSLFERSNYSEYHEIIKAFILENYYTLTCEPSINKKKLTVLLQVDDINKPPFGNYGKQPVVCYLYKHKSYKVSDNKPVFKHYNKENYKSEKKSINGFIRKLPTGQQASEEAIQFAIQLGYELNNNETYVRPFIKHVLKIKDVK